MKRNVIYCGDCVSVMSYLPDDSIDLIVTSPPYNIGGSHAHNFKFAGYDGYNDNIDNYDEFMGLALAEMYRVLKPSGSLMLNHKPRTVNKECVHPLSIVFESSFTLKQEIVWDKNSTHMHNKDRFYPTNEMIYWCVKDKEQTKFNGDCSKFTTVWKFPRVNKKGEGCEWFPAPFPIELPKRCIETFTDAGDVVLDPFMGSGTTAIAAKMLGRDYIGCELSQLYCEQASCRIEGIT